MLKEFREFVTRGNVIDLAIGIIIGAAFGTIVNSLVTDVIMPPIGLLLGNVDFTNLFVVLRSGAAAPPPYHTLAEAQAAGAVTINYGVFINTIITFLIIAFAVFMIVRWVNRIRREAEARMRAAVAAAAPATPSTKGCPFCKSEVHLEAMRCPHCTSMLG